MALRFLLGGRVKATAQAGLRLRPKLLGISGEINNHNLPSHPFSYFHTVSVPTLGLRLPVRFPTVTVPGDVDLPSVAHESLNVDKIANFAVNEHNAKKNVNLQFVRVVSASQERDTGMLVCIKMEKTDLNPRDDSINMKYPWIKRLSHFVACTEEENKLMKIHNASFVRANAFFHYITLEALDEGKQKVFSAVVWVEQLRNLMDLMQLNPISDASDLLASGGKDAAEGGGKEVEATIS